MVEEEVVAAVVAGICYFISLCPYLYSVNVNWTKDNNFR